MMESALPKDARTPEIPVGVDVVDDLVSAAGYGDEVHPILEVVLISSHEVDLDDFQGKAVCIQKFSQ